MHKIQTKTNKNDENQDITGTKCVKNMNDVTEIEHLNKLTPNIEASENDEHATTGYRGDAPVYAKINQKSRKEIEDAKKPKNFLIMNKQNLKKKINNFKATDCTEQNQINNRNEMKLKVNSFEKNLNISNANELESMKAEMEILNTNMERLNDNFKRVTTELSEEKKNNITLMNSLTSTLNKYQDLEFDKKIQQENVFKEQLRKMSKKIENLLAEKNDILNHLKESEIALSNAYDEINFLKEEYHQKLTEKTEKLRAIEEESHQWNKYQIELEELITEGHKALSRKEEYIKHQDFIISTLESKLSESKDSAVIDTRQLKKLSTTVVDTKSRSQGH